MKEHFMQRISELQAMREEQELKLRDSEGTYLYRSRVQEMNAIRSLLELNLKVWNAVKPVEPRVTQIKSKHGNH
jgi:hypothetical protein